MKVLMLALACVSGIFAAEIEIGKPLPTVTISEKDGGYVNGGAFSTADLRGKIHVLMYVDPDESDAGDNLNEALDKAKEDFPDGTFKTVAVINMAATWLPNFAIRSKLRSKQEKYPNAGFVKDEESVLVNELKLADDAFIAMIVDANGTVLRQSQAPFSEEEVAAFVGVVRDAVAKIQ